MAKIRVHELAKEYDVPAKEVMSFLSGHNIEVASHMSTLEDDAVAMVRNKYGKKAEEAPKTEDAKKERPKKKASISAVYNPQNSKMGDRRPAGGRNGQNPRAGRPNGAAGRPADGTRPSQDGIRRNPAERPDRKSVV